MKRTWKSFPLTSCRNSDTSSSFSLPWERYLQSKKGVKPQALFPGLQEMWTEVERKIQRMSTLIRKQVNYNEKILLFGGESGVHGKLARTILRWIYEFFCFLFGKKQFKAVVHPHYPILRRPRQKVSEENWHQ